MSSLGKDNKKRTHDNNMSTSKTPKRVQTIEPTYQIVKEGRVSGYPIIVKQVGSEHDAILLGCKATDNPQEYLDNNKDGKVKIRWKFAGYNGLVSTSTVRLNVVDFKPPPIRKAAALSSLLERGEGVKNNDGSKEPTPSIVTSQLGIKSEDIDADSVATDPMYNDDVVPMAVTSEIINVKTEEEETDDDEPKPSAVTSDANIKLEGDVKKETAGYGYDTDNDEPKPLIVKSDINVKDEEDTDDEMNAAADDAIVLEFFEKLNSFLKKGDGPVMSSIIKTNQYLLKAKCPQDMDNIEKGLNAMEAACQPDLLTAYTFELLLELVELGGKATDKCYEELAYWGNIVPIEHLVVLLLSGYYPIHWGPYFYLDRLVEKLYEGESPEIEDAVQILGILTKTVKVGDELSWARVDSTMMNNINQLPSLEVGVTHSKGGPMEELLKLFPVGKARDLREYVEEIVEEAQKEDMYYSLKIVRQNVPLFMYPLLYPYSGLK